MSKLPIKEIFIDFRKEGYLGSKNILLYFMIKKSTTSDVKNHNRNLIYQYVLEENNLSQKDIAAKFQLSLPTVIQNLNELKMQNLILEQGHYQSTGGRKAKRFIPNTNARAAIGLDITKNHIALAITNLTGDIIEASRIRCQYEDTPAFYSKIVRLIDDMLYKHAIDTESILGLGVSVPGIIEKDHKTISVSMLIDNLQEGTSLYDHLSCYFNYPIYIENDATSSGFAEFWHSPSATNIFYLFLGNSVGGAIYFNNAPYAGENSHSAEIGHTTLIPGGETCYCGRKGCVDCYCAARVLSDYAGGSLENFFFNLRNKVPGYQKKMDEYIDYLAIAIMNIRMLFDCDIMIGGYVGSFIGPYINDLKKRINKQDIFSKSADYILTCTLKSESSALGAAMIFIDKFRKSI